MTRGFTLIELMITVAILTITATAIGASLDAPTREAGRILAEERLLQAAEYTAAMIAEGLEPDAELQARLLEDAPAGSRILTRTLPGGLIEVRAVTAERVPPLEASLMVVPGR